MLKIYENLRSKASTLLLWTTSKTILKLEAEVQVAVATNLVNLVGEPLASEFKSPLQCLDPQTQFGKQIKRDRKSQY